MQAEKEKGAKARTLEYSTLRAAEEEKPAKEP